MSPEAARKAFTFTALAAAAFAWGLAEATIFFIVPDVLITAAAIFSRRAAAVALIAALSGALIGGAAMYTWENHQPGAAATLVESTPGVTPELLDRAERQLRRGRWDGPGGKAGAMLLGGVSFLPFKAYAVSAPLAGMSLPVFLVCAAAARGARFAATALFTRWLVTRPLRRLSRRHLLALHLLIWGAIYAAYFGFVVQ